MDIDKIPFTDNILFSTVLSNEAIAKELLELILQIKITNIVYTNREEHRDTVGKSKGVRFDVYVEDSNNIYDVEMQTSNTKDLPKRARYYQAKNDIHLLQKGNKYYNKLKRSYIIFICNFNPFASSGTNECIYKFENVCVIDSKNFLRLKDEAYKIFVNSKCDLSKIRNKSLKALMELINDGLNTTETKSTLTDNIISEMKKTKMNLEWRTDYMTQQEHDMDVREEGREEERENGIFTLIKSYRKLNIPTNIIVEQLIETYNLSKEEAFLYLK